MLTTADKKGFLLQLQKIRLLYVIPNRSKWKILTFIFVVYGYNYNFKIINIT